MTYVLSNLHGNPDAFRAMLSEISFKESDLMYVLGDIVDYGSEPMELVEDLSMRLNVYPVAGEHDFLAARMLSGYEKMQKTGKADPAFAEEMSDWVRNEGGMNTLEGFRNLDADAREGVLDYLSEMPLYEECQVAGQSYLLLHEGIADFAEGDDPEDFLADDFFSEPLDPKKCMIPGTTVIVGHKPNENGKITRGKGSIFVDCGLERGGRLGCLCLETGEEYYV